MDTRQLVDWGLPLFFLSPLILGALLVVFHQGFRLGPPWKPLSFVGAALVPWVGTALFLSGGDAITLCFTVAGWVFEAAGAVIVIVRLFQRLDPYGGIGPWLRSQLKALLSHEARGTGRLRAAAIFVAGSGFVTASDLSLAQRVGLLEQQFRTLQTELFAKQDELNRRLATAEKELQHLRGALDQLNARMRRDLLHGFGTEVLGAALVLLGQTYSTLAPYIASIIATARQSQLSCQRIDHVDIPSSNHRSRTPG